MRPRGSVIRGTGARTPGAVEMLNMWNQTALTLTKGPESKADRDDVKTKIRKGAMMVTLGIWHPDIIEFIEAKQSANALTNFNMSVLVSDAFMKAVEQDREWTLKFPDYEAQPSRYKQEWDGDLRNWSGPVKEYRTVSARQLWDTIMTNTYRRNEPGVIFRDTVNNRNPLWYEENILATNPCGEQPLPSHGSCDLGNLVLPRYLDSQRRINYEMLRQDIYVMVRLLDNVNDKTAFPLEEQLQEAQRKRRIGLGHMGFGSLCLLKGIRYGSDRSVELARKLQNFITNRAYAASARLAKEKEPFPAFDFEKYSQGEVYQRLDSHVQMLIKKYGLRNSHLTSIQPTGNTSCLAGNVTGGIEPVFAADYTRTVEEPYLPEGIRKPPHTDVKEGKMVGSDEGQNPTMWRAEKQGDEIVLRCQEDGYEDWQIHPSRGIVRDVEVTEYATGKLKEEYGEVPYGKDWFVTTADLGVSDHVRVMKAFAEMVDAGISKTVNVPADYPFKEFKSLYRDLWSSGVIKGGTTYRKGTMSAVLKDGKDEESVDKEQCPQCGGTSIAHEENCESCMDCGWSKCSI
jgi:ribonucleoside-diphosphate reductase alpha chain